MLYFKSMGIALTLYFCPVFSVKNILIDIDFYKMILTEDIVFF